MKNILFTLLLLGSGTIFSLQAQIEITPAEDLPDLLAQVDLTKDVNTTFFEVWQLPIFEELAKTEARVITILTGTMKVMKLPVETTFLHQVGTYNHKGLQKLNDRLVVSGSSSKTEALMASAELEEHQILFLEKALEHTEDVDVILLYDRIRSISKDNLRDIVAELFKEGVAYRPVAMSDQYFDMQVMIEAAPVF